MRPQCIFLAAAFVIGAIPPTVVNAGTCTPDPFYEVFLCGINLVGMRNGVADPRGEFMIELHDLAGNPQADCEVTVDFGACGDVRIATVQPSPGVTVECLSTPSPHALVHATTDAMGMVRMRIVGGANNTGNSPAAGYKCATVYAGGVNLGSINVGAYDQNGGGGVNPADLSLFLGDSFDVDFEGRSDYNCSNTINPADLSLILAASLGSGSTESAPDYCQ